VARAAGISAVSTQEMTAEEYLSSKISVVVAPFYEVTESEPIINTSALPFPTWVLFVIIGVLAFLIILTIVILVIGGKKKKKKKQAELESQQAIEAVLAAAVGGGENPEELKGADVMTLQSEKSMELRKSIRRFVDENPELASQMLKTWLRGGNENG
jgi:flagellar M-ring protein FliF